MRAQGLSARRWSALAVLCVSLLIVTLDNTVLNVALPTLVRRLQATSSDLQWIVDAYVLAFAGLMLVAGSLADRIGRKVTFMAGLVVFAGCSAWAAFSGSVSHLVAARACMGAGAALIMPSTLAIITNTFTDGRERQHAIGLWAATSGAGIALGPIVGGILLTHFWWGSVFLINVPVAVVGVAFAIRLVPNSRNPEARRPDIIGSGLSVAGLGMVLFAVIEAPVHGWSSAVVLGTGLGGLVVLGAFLLWERSSSHPMMNLALFRRRSFSAPIMSVSLMMFGLFGALFLLTQFLQFQLGYTPLQAGVRMLPTAGAIAVVAPLSDRLVRAIGTRMTVSAGMLIAAIGLWQTSSATTSTAYHAIVVGMALVGVGAGLVIPSATASVMGSVPQEHTGVGGATNGTFLQTGGALGVAVIGSLFANRYEDRVASALAPLHIPEAAQQAIGGSIGAALAVAGQVGGTAGAVVASVARSAFVSAMDMGLAVAAFVMLVAAALALVTVPGKSPSAGVGSAGPPASRGGTEQTG